MRYLSRFLTLCILLALSPYLVEAQSIETPIQAGHETCGSDEHHAYRMQTDAAYKARHIERMAALKVVRQTLQNAPRERAVQYTIPVVVHIIHLGESIGTGTNIPDAQVLDAIDGLNERYANANGMGADIEINFCLANRDPNGCPTSGINRVDGSGVPLYASEGITYGGGCGADEFELKSLSLWPVDQYYNIWVVHDICGDIAGYAYYPNGDWFDGTVIDVPSMNSGSRVLAHELGHGLNLQHTFSGDEEGTTCPPDFDCAADGDEVCDTPPHRRNDCGLNNPCGSVGAWDDSRYNWMSYCSTEPALGRFTDDQRTRMRATMLEWPRMTLPESPGCDNAENMRITSDNELMCSGEERLLTATPSGGFFAIADGPGTIEGDVLTATGGGIIVVEYIISQQECTSSVFQAISTRQAVTSRLLSDADSLCIGQTTTLRGIPGGGDFMVVNGPGTIEGNVLTATGEGAIELEYAVTVLGCVSRDEEEVMSIEQPEVEIEFLSGDFLVAVPENGTFQWLTCDPVVEPIPGATASTYTANTSGSYAVVMQQGDCVDTSACVIVEVTSVEDGNLDDEIRLYPNPVTDVLYLEVEGGQSPITIVLSDMQGQRITSVRFPGQPKTGLNVAGFTPGVYLMNIEVEGRGRYYYKFIKV